MYTSSWDGAISNTVSDWRRKSYGDEYSMLTIYFIRIR